MKKVLFVASLLVSGCVCVARGTLVRTPRGMRPIEDLSVGDPVFAVEEDSGALVPTKITAIREATREVGLLAFGGQELRLTSDHPVYCPTDDLYAPAGDWFLGQRTSLLRVLDEGTEVVTPDQVETYVGVADVFDITVESELHNFVAQGFLVHNKSEPNNDESELISLECEIDGVLKKAGDSCVCPDGSDGELNWETATPTCDEGHSLVCMVVDGDTGRFDPCPAAGTDMGGMSDSGNGTNTGTDAGM